MTRILCLTLFVVSSASLAASAVRAELPVAPQPREIRPDGTRDPAPRPEPPKDENPAVTVDRIIKNSKAVEEKLAKPDTGDDTRKTQAKILSDIDSLINRQENPPPQPDKNDDKQDKDKNKEKNMDNKSDPKMDMGMDKKGDMPMGMGGMNEPPPMGRKPRMGDPKDDKKQPGNEPKDPMKNQGGDPKDPKDPSGKAAGVPGGKMPGMPSLPFDDDVAKDVWGHLPMKLRQQMTQYYKEDFMPRYSELLRLYYSSLAEKSGEPKK